MRSGKNVLTFLTLCLVVLFSFGSSWASTSQDMDKKIMRLQERILALIPAKKSARANHTVFQNIQAEIDKELRTATTNHAFEIQLEGLKECLQKVESGLKENRSCQKIESDIFLNYGNRSAEKENMPQFAQTAVSILTRLCPAK